MPIDFQYDHKLNTVNIKVEGALDSSEIVEYFKNVLDGNIVKEGFIEVVDLNDATDFILRYTDLSLIKDLTSKLNNIGQKGTVMCAYNDVSKGISSMMTSLYHAADFEFYLCDSEIERNKSLKVLQK